MPLRALLADRNTYSGAELGASIRRTLKMLVIATVILFVLLVALLTYTYTVSKNNRDALCIFRSDLESRIHQTEDYLAKNPSPEPIPGVSRTTLLTNLEGQKRAAGSFEHLNCPDFPKG